MILREIPLKTFDDELASLANLDQSNITRDTIFGAILAVRWLRNGGIAPSEKLKSAATETH